MYNQCVQAPCHIGVKDIYEYATCSSLIMHLIAPPRQVTFFNVKIDKLFALPVSGMLGVSV